MATVTAVLRTSKVNAQGTAPICLRVSDRDKSRFVSLKVRARASQWNERQGRVRKNHPQADEINELIAARIGHAESEAIRLKRDRVDPTADDLKAALATRPRETDFFSFADTIVAELEERGQIHLQKRYKSVLTKLRAFTREPLPMGRLTHELMRRYETHMQTHYGNSVNTAKVNFNAIRALVTRAVREGHMEVANDPFLVFRPRKMTRPDRGKLTMAEFEVFEGLTLEPQSLLWHTRNYFVFALLCAGIRFGDFARLKRENVTREGENVRLTYSMGKTGTQKSIKLVPRARAILNLYPARVGSPYLFPVLDRYDVSTPKKMVGAVSSQNAVTNKYLKTLQEMAGIETKITFHIARHSFADIARTEGLDVYTISKALGHSSLKITEAYLKGFDTGALDAAMDGLFGEDPS